MADGVPYSGLRSTILEIAREQKYKKWTPVALAKLASERNDYRGAIVGILVRAMALSGELGYDTVGDTITRVYWKENENNGHTNDQAVREATEACEQWKRNYEGAKKGLESSSKMIAELQEQLKSKTKEIVVGVKITEPDGTERQMDGFFHEKFKRLTQLALMRQNIFLYGPTGSGKTFVCRQLADVLGMDFSFVSCSSGMSEGTLGGRLLPVGDGGKFEYIVSEYLQRYENGGVFLADEMDAADANVLIFLNASLANGKCAVPNRPDKPYAKRHKDFIFIGASNTVGTGADRMYSGRNKLDMATLDRFQTGKVFIDYDTKVEEGIAAQFTEECELLNWCWGVRKAINAHRLERAMSTRFIIDSHKMMYGKNAEGELIAGWSMEEIQEAYFCGWREDEVNKVKNEMRY